MNGIRPYDLLATAVLALGHDGAVLAANVAAQELFGLPERRLAGMHALALFGSDTALATRFSDALAGHYGVLGLQTTASGQLARFPVSLTVVPLAQHEWAALLEVRNLEHQGVPDRTQQLGKELQVQRESLRNLAHEVKNPLGGIRGAAQLLEAELGNSSLREYTGVIVAEADRLRALIDRLIAPQGESLAMQRFNVHEVCERVRTLITAEFSPLLAVQPDYDASVPDMTGDPERLLQALLNVARNGAQAMLEQGRHSTEPLLVIRTRVGRSLALAHRPARLGLVISVVDNGPGVPAHLHDKVFHPLVTGRAQGTGLGLSLAQEFVQQHGGIIEFDSRPAHTEFRLILPISVS